ncbi:MAG: hypothetical protein C0478_04095 [Planctomyces sp.]|nr:hypothetical protein [Planctomyces sp.]
MNLIRSEYVSDPDYEELIADFVSAMPERVAELLTAIEGRDFDELKRKAHQLKGAGGGYGFPEMTTIAAQVESACRENRIPDVLDQTAALVDYLRRVSV